MTADVSLKSIKKNRRVLPERGGDRKGKKNYVPKNEKGKTRKFCLKSAMYGRGGKRIGQEREVVEEGGGEGTGGVGGCHGTKSKEGRRAEEEKERWGKKTGETCEQKEPWKKYKGGEELLGKRKRRT